MIKSNLVILTLGMVACLSAVSADTSKRGKKSCPELCSTAPFTPKDDCCKNIHIDLGLLYQQPIVDNMFPGISYAQTRNETIDGVDYVNTDGEALFPCFDYAIGLTASLGYFMNHDSWYLGARFDWLSRDISVRYNYTSNPSGYILYATPFFIGDELDSAFPAINALEDVDEFDRLTLIGDVNFYMLDILLSRGSYHSRYFSYEPFAGVKAVWFDSSLNSTLYSKAQLDNGYSNLASHSWGVGPMFGVNGEWQFVKCFALFADSDIGVLYGEADQSVSAYYEDYTDSTLDRVDNDTIKGNADCMIYVPVRTVLGLKFSTYYKEDSHYLALKIGYDARAIMPFPDRDRGFYMSGLYANLIWNF